VIAHPTVSPDQIAAIRCAIEELLTGLLTLVGCGLDLDTHSGQAQHEQRPAQARPASRLLA
jgi:hypothetical protein